MEVLGIDVGGSAIKGAIVNLETGEFTVPRLRIPMPEGAMPRDVADVIKTFTQEFQYSGPTGVGFPCLLKDGVALTAANVDKSWLGVNVPNLFTSVTGSPVYVINDADAAGVAEMRYGSGKEFPRGVVLFLTLGTGIGSAIFLDGKLLPNTEFGHLEVRGKDAEKRASAAVRTKKKLSWKEWSKRLNEVLARYELLVSPDVIILGGGISKDAGKFIHNLQTRAKIIPAQLENQAGIVGAALYAAQQMPE